jgi:ABC-2 type transport system ATP-binding protein
MPDKTNTSTEPKSAVSLVELTKKFGDFFAVDHISFEVAEGEIFGLIGPNGAGKSTAIKMLTTLLPLTSGTATVAGCDIVRQAGEVRRKIGYVPQLLSADGSLTGYENMLLSARLYGIPRQQQAQRILDALGIMGLADYAGHLVSRYSGGMIRRLEIALSMLHRPAVLFMDEPTSGLDPAAREAVWDHISELRQRFHTTIIVTSHYMEEVEALCHRVALIARGRIAAIGTPAELKSSIGPDATLDDVFEALVDASETETERSYGDVRRARRAARQHG